MSKPWMILIPPSEGKTAGGKGTPIRPTKDVQEMIDRLHGYEGDWNKLLGVKDKALEEAIEANAAVLTAKTLPAIERYAGVVYDGIDYASLSKEGRASLDTRVRIVSALFGLVKPRERIPNYKLKIEKLDAASFWKPRIEARLKKHFVIDLLPQAHRKAVAYPEGIEVEFIVEKKGKRMPAGHFGKLIKGQFVRWLCENQIDTLDAFRNFTEDGYAWNGECFYKSADQV